MGNKQTKTQEQKTSNQDTPELRHDDTLGVQSNSAQSTQPATNQTPTIRNLRNVFKDVELVGKLVDFVHVFKASQAESCTEDFEDLELHDALEKLADFIFDEITENNSALEKFVNWKLAMTVTGLSHCNHGTESKLDDNFSKYWESWIGLILTHCQYEQNPQELQKLIHEEFQPWCHSNDFISDLSVLLDNNTETSRESKQAQPVETDGFKIACYLLKMATNNVNVKLSLRRIMIYFKYYVKRHLTDDSEDFTLVDSSTSPGLNNLNTKFTKWWKQSFAEDIIRWVLWPDLPNVTLADVGKQLGYQSKQRR